MKTKQLYLEDCYQREMDAQVLAVVSEGEGKWRLILDQTVFYPMGGGQPTDQGKLTISGQEVVVYLVMYKDGEIWHYANVDTAPEIGATAHGVIDWDRRYQNMQVHSAGHVIDFAMHLLGYSPAKLQPLKADHGKKPFILYAGVLDQDIRSDLENRANELVEKDLALTAEFVPLETLQKEAIYLQPGLPTGKPLRMLKLATVGAVADGGTQVKSTAEVGKIAIEEIAPDNGNTVVKYRLNP